MSERIAIGYDSDYFSLGVAAKIWWTVRECPHGLCYGASGSGKTYAVKLILARIGLNLPEARVTVLDFKNDFDFLSDSKNYYGFYKCNEGLKEFYTIFEARLSGEDKSRTLRFLFIDELVAWLNSLEKKEAENIKKQLGNILMTGRSIGIILLCSVQRPDSSYFAGGARENFGMVCGLGTLSRESLGMFFSDFKDEMQPCGRGEGYVLFNGAELKRIIVPTVKNEDKLNFYIRKALNG
ncbi:MAG: AAA family ATPase [Ruminococcus sp.]|nr:AAA family ATPase [Ruminococcus sp.]